MKNTISASLFALALLSACNGTNELPEMKGLLLNHTPFATTDFEIQVELRCSTRDLLGFRNDCGSVSQTVSPNADGSFVLPPLKAGSALGATYDFEATITLGGESGRSIFYRYRTARYGISDFSKIPLLAKLTAFYIQEQKLNFVPRSGQESTAWAASMGRDAAVSFRADFGSKLDNLYDDVDLQGPRLETIEQLPAQIVYVEGLLPANAPVNVHAELRSATLKPGCRGLQECLISSIDLSAPFSSELPLAFRTFAFDDSMLVRPAKTLAGEWKATLLFHGNYIPGVEHNLYDATAKLTCDGGVIHGMMSVTSRPANEHQFQGEIPVTGTCGDESGEIRFRFRYSNQVDEQELSIRYDRIAGDSDALLSRELDKQDSFQGMDYTYQLLIHDHNGDGQGRAHITR